ncbi:MAG: CpaF family protein [bacterium]
MDSTVRSSWLESFAVTLRERLVDQSRSAALAGRSLGPAEESIAELVERDAALLSSRSREELRELIEREALGLGPLEELLADPSVDEVLVVGHDRVWMERRGRLERTDVRFRDAQSLDDAIERLLAPLGRRVDELSPMADARLVDGSRVNVTVPPLAIDGACLSIRRFGAERPSLRDLIEKGTLSERMFETLTRAVERRENILISGGTGAGKTTLLNALSAHIDPSERIVTIEDAAELRLSQEHVVRLESRPANVEGRGEVTIRDLLRNALRMRPDRLLIGEVRGAEALDLVIALNTGHDGALSTVHANSPEDSLVRLEMLATLAGGGLEAGRIRDQLVRALDLIVQIDRVASGERLVTAVARLGAEGIEPVDVHPSTQ